MDCELFGDEKGTERVLRHSGWNPLIPTWLIGGNRKSACLSFHFSGKANYQAVEQTMVDSRRDVDNKRRRRTTFWFSWHQSGEKVASKEMRTKEAKDFLVQQTAEQAALEGISLSDLEKRMMYFAENDATSCADPLMLNQEFEAQYDTEEYETKIASMLHDAYKRLKSEEPEKTR
jgi:hypothetical protein